MADGKKKIIVYSDWLQKFEALTDEEAGKLIKHFFRYVNDLNPEYPDRITELSFIDIKNTLKRDLELWEKRAEKSRENGKLGGRQKKETESEETKQDNLKPKISKQVILEPKEPVNVNDSVNVSDSDILLFNNNNREKHPLQILIESKFSNVASLKKQLSSEEAFKIEKKFSKAVIRQVLEGMENKKDLTKKYVSVYLTLNKWCENQKPALPAANENQSRIERLKNL